MLLPAIGLLKELVGLISCDKKNITVGSKEILNPFKHLDEEFEVTTVDIEKGIMLEKEYNFTLATSVRIKTIIDADFPPPSANCINLNHSKSGDNLLTISPKVNSVNKILNVSKFKLSMKINNEQQKDLVYTGCTICIRPKVILKIYF